MTNGNHEMKAKGGFEELLSAIKQSAFAVLARSGTSFRYRLMAMNPLILMQRFGLQLGLYCLILFGAVGVTLNGSQLLIQIVCNEMSRMGYEVAKQNLPQQIETASLRTSMK